MKMDILKDFPSYGWICKLSKTRCFSGSAGTHPAKGSFEVNTFVYKVWREDDSLHASCYVKPPANSELDPFGQDEMECPLSEENTEIIKNWLKKQFEKYSEIIGNPGL